jgi:CubicO group peptidase (beta-lactamase class C family)
VTKLADLEPELRRIVDEYRREHHVPGVALAVAVGDEVVEYASGVLNLNTGVEATPDSLFLIGSITKTFTATLVMQLVDEGLVDLDKPVRDYVPEFSLADREAGETVTVRQLLCHTGGFDGDVFDDFGRGDDALARYVEALKNRSQVHAPGRMFSYSNSGYSVLGRLVEHVRQLPSWDVALRRHLIEPLGLTHTASLPEEAILFRAAAGHVEGDGDDGDEQAEQRVVSAWASSRSQGPMGGGLGTTARELVEWAWFHLHGGLAKDGTRLLSAASAAAMLEAQVALPGFDDGFPHVSWGLGWSLSEYENGRVVSHGGYTDGQLSTLVIVPEAKLVLAVLTNSLAALRLIDAVRDTVLKEIAGIEVPPRPGPPNPPIEVDPHRFIGRYHTASAYYQITQDPASDLMGEWGVLDHQEQPDVRPRTYRMTGFSPSVLIASEPPNGLPFRWAFPEIDADGRATFVTDGSRVALRVDDSVG